MAWSARKGVTALAAVVLVLTAPVAAQSAKSMSEMDGDELFAAYRATGPSVLESAFTLPARFEKFRNSFRDRTLKEWVKNKCDPQKAMFMLDIAIVAQPRQVYWADFLHLGLDYLRNRVDAVGRLERVGDRPDVDAFEILWSKTAIAFASGRRHPEVVDTLVKLVLRRMAAVAAPPPRPGARVMPKLIDPWIALAQGYAAEAFVHVARRHLDDHGKDAITAYDRAVQFEETRAEATVRKAWLLLEIDRAADALAALDGFSETWTNEAVTIYWARLLRGRALAAVGKLDEAIRAYGAALELVPSAQSPRVGIMAIETRRGRPEVAEAIAKDIRTALDPVHDPWWVYPHGDLRFFPQREKALRAMAAR